MTDRSRKPISRHSCDGQILGARRESKDAPAPSKFVTGWNIGNPDLVIEMPNAYTVPAKGTIEYTYYVIPTGFTEDKWVRFAEVRPGNRKVVHHVIAFIREPGSKWMRDAVPGKPYVPKKGGDGEAGSDARWLVGYAPGTIPNLCRARQAVLIKAGSDIVLQMHYTANGEEQTDQSKIGMVFAKEPPSERVMMLAASNKKFVIPPGADDHKVEAQITLAGGYNADGTDPAHASCAEGVRVPRCVSDRRNAGTPASAAIRLQLAVGIYSRKADRASEGKPNRVYGVVRQLPQQSE